MRLGISGGGDLSANRTFALDISELTTDEDVDIDNDFIPFHDTSESSGTPNKVTARRVMLQTIILDVSRDETTVLTTGTSKLVFRMPYAMKLTKIKASLAIASTTGTVTVDVNESGSTIMTTDKLTFDATESTTETATTAPALTDTDLAADAEITVDIDDAGSSADAAGLKVYLIGKVATTG